MDPVSNSSPIDWLIGEGHITCLISAYDITQVTLNRPADVLKTAFKKQTIKTIKETNKSRLLLHTIFLL